MLTVVSWRWNDGKCKREFLPEYVNIHRAMVKRHLKQPHRYVCITDDPRGIECETYPLWPDLFDLSNLVGPHLPSCYKRLKIFDPATTRAMGILDGEPVVSADLDMVIVNEVDSLFNRGEDFVGWRVPGGRHQSVFNGTVFMHRAGTQSRIWTAFQPRTSPQVAKQNGFFGTDQGWLSYILGPKAAGWTRADGVVGYSQDCRLIGRLPPYAKIVSFHGKRKPWEKPVQIEAPWIKEHWRM